MRRFFLQGLLTASAVILAVIIVFSAISAFRVLMFRHQSGNMYIWGDSQMVQGIDMSMIRSSSEFDPLSSANHGGGVYDFLVFARSVPDSSYCLVSFSECCLLRKKSSDYNRSGLDLNAISVLIREGYGWGDLLDIIDVNRHKLFPKQSRHNYLYPYSDSITFSEPLSGFEEMYSAEPSYLRQKIRIYRTGLSWLSEKGCRILILDLPFYKFVADFSDSSPMRSSIDSEIDDICSSLGISSVDTIRVADKDSLLMFDLSHLNEVGARRVTKQLLNYLDTADMNLNHFLSVNGGVCGSVKVYL